MTMASGCSIAIARSSSRSSSGVLEEKFEGSLEEEDDPDGIESFHVRVRAMMRMMSNVHVAVMTVSQVSVRNMRRAKARVTRPVVRRRVLPDPLLRLSVAMRHR